MLTINNTLEGYLKDVEILGNTIQDASNLADIRSVGDAVEGQELYEIPVVSCGKNLFDKNTCVDGYILSGSKGEANITASWFYTDFIKVKAGVTYRMGSYKQPFDPYYSCLYSKDKTFIKANIGEVFTPSENGYVRLSGIIENKDKGQLEESAIITPYEPYQEDKLTILSPVQLEKVGDVADRIIEKDGVWGVEKNVETIVLNGSESWKTSASLDTDFTQRYYFNFSPNGIMDVKNGCICDVIKGDINGVETYTNIYPHSNGMDIHIKKLKTDSRWVTIDELKTFLSNNNMKFKYVTTQPQFIPLPHDQQIKLRTFANKTNISFLTEIEGTIKAQVPKSLGATVNTHTEQIRSLNNELNRVKKLEESTVSTVTTESDFTTVEATSNGYFEDVKLEGKTLVNLAKQPTNNGYINNQYATISKVTNIEPSTEYTYIIRNNGSEMVKLYLNNKYCFTWTSVNVEVNSTVIGKAKSLPTISGDIWLSLNEAQTVEQNLQIVLLEGDHTQNPPSFFEGLKSVGQSASEDGVDEIVVESVNENLISKTDLILNNSLGIDGNQISHVGRVCTDFIKVPSNCTLYFRGTNNSPTPNRSYVCFYDKDKNAISSRIQFDNFEILTPHNCRYARFITHDASLTNLNDVVYELYIGSLPNQYTPHQSDKKRLLYYNNETQTWEKPILRKWDSIEKHADGKYYYHQRSGEVVLNGSENWCLADPASANENNLRLYIAVQDALIASNVICDKFTIVDTVNYEGVKFANNKNLHISIAKSKLSTQDVAGFKKWLQANNVTVVYQLAQEKVYECTNIDLITYNGETNYIVESGVIVPRTTLKVHNNISNVVNILQEKVSLLENKFIQGLKQVLAGDMYSLAELLYPEDFVEENPENEIMLLPFE